MLYQDLQVLAGICKRPEQGAITVQPLGIGHVLSGIFLFDGIVRLLLEKYFFLLKKVSAN